MKSIDPSFKEIQEVSFAKGVFFGITIIAIAMLIAYSYAWIYKIGLDRGIEISESYYK